MKLEFEEEARLELRQAARWYDEQKHGLGSDFLADVRSALGEISEHPARWPKLTSLTRRYRLDRFPYWIVYQVRTDCLRIIAVMHQSRHPNSWKRRRGR